MRLPAASRECDDHREVFIGWCYNGARADGDDDDVGGDAGAAVAGHVPEEFHVCHLLTLQYSISFSWHHDY